MVAAIIRVLIGFFIISSVGYAQTIPLNKLSPKECKISVVIDALILQSSDREKLLLKNQSMMQEEMKRLSASAPVTPFQKWQSDQPAEKLKIINLALLAESNYQRDLQVIQRLTNTATDYYKSMKFPEKDSPDLIYAGLLVLWGKDLKPQGNDSTATMCTLDYAIYANELEPANRLIKLQAAVKNSEAQVHKMFAKYKTQDINPSILSAADKRKLAAIQEKVLTPYQRELDYAIDLENIRHFVRISELVRDTYTKALHAAGDKVVDLEDTIKKLMNDASLSGEDKMMLDYWQKINKKIPSTLGREEAARKISPLLTIKFNDLKMK